MSTAWLKDSNNAPDGLAAWAESQPSLDAAIAAAPRADWLLWLNAQRNPSDNEQRHLVQKALYLGNRTSSNMPSTILRPTLSDEQLAAEWAHPGGNDSHYLAGDMINAIIVALVITVPIAIVVRLHWPNLGALGPSLVSIVVGLPIAAVVAISAYFMLRGFRRSNTARRLHEMSYEKARNVAFTSMSRGQKLPDATAQKEADLFRMQWPKP